MRITIPQNSRCCAFLIILTLLIFPFIAHALPGDLNGSGRVDGDDLIVFGLANGSSDGDANWNPDADLDENGEVEQVDFEILSAHYGNHGVSFGLWVGDEAGTERVTKVSSTGNILRRVAAVGNPACLSSDSSDGAVWVADSVNDQITKLDGYDGARLLTVSGVDAYALSVNSRDGSVWVADYSNNRIVKLLPNVTDGYAVGTDSGSDLIINGFYRPRAVSVNPNTGVVWVADTFNNKVVRISPDMENG
jgi:DNA-binding beta-propeller fold protein YncE